MLAIVSVAAVLLASAHEAPARVTVTICPDVEPVAVQLANSAESPIVGVDGNEKPDGKETKILSPAPRAPVALGLRPTVQVAGVAPAVCGLPEKVTGDSDPAVEILMPDAGDAA